MSKIQPLPENLQKVAIEELGEVPSRLYDDLQALELWIQQQPHLRARTDHQLLVQFLRGCKFSLQRAKEKLESYYSLKSKYPELQNPTDVDAPQLRNLFQMGCIVPLPRPLNDCGTRIMLYRYNYPVDKFSIQDVILLDVLLHDILLIDDPYACIYGVIYLVDLSSFSAGHILQFSPSVLKKSLTYMENSLPLRVKAMGLINMPTFAEQFCNLFISFLSKKLRERVFFCSKKLEHLSDKIPLKYLPVDYGGENGRLEEICSDYTKIWNKYRLYFEENLQYGVDEHLRPAKSINDGMYGMGGTFRKIDVD
ncbi:retinol-binding protein pinta-like [Musca vetustissima]|uniref:retinol-binding protein pinta-like n=1 Tax=Musca vetustissima TaxID=27455 RepID=UPI002AB6CAC3|nr:retinol-binding protein pinta-like [Musca vetustissima]